MEDPPEPGEGTETGSSPDGGFAGWASVFHRIDSHGTIFAPTAFDRTLADFLAKGFVAGLNHDWDNPIGAPVEARVDPARGLFVRAELVPTEAGEQARVLLAHKLSTGRPVIQSLSFGFNVLASQSFATADAVKAYWAGVGYTPEPADLDALTRTLARNGSVIVFTDVTLYEVSPVTVPGNRWAEVTEARGRGYVFVDRTDQAAAELVIRHWLAGLHV